MMCSILSILRPCSYTKERPMVCLCSFDFIEFRASRIMYQKPGHKSTLKTSNHKLAVTAVRFDRGERLVRIADERYVSHARSIFCRLPGRTDRFKQICLNEE